MLIVRHLVLRGAEADVDGWGSGAAVLRDTSCGLTWSWRWGPASGLWPMAQTRNLILNHTHYDAVVVSMSIVVLPLVVLPLVVLPFLPQSLSTSPFEYFSTKKWAPKISGKVLYSAAAFFFFLNKKDENSSSSASYVLLPQISGMMRTIVVLRELGELGGGWANSQQLTAMHCGLFTLQQHLVNH